MYALLSNTTTILGHLVLGMLLVIACGCSDGQQPPDTDGDADLFDLLDTDTAGDITSEEAVDGDSESGGDDVDDWECPMILDLCHWDPARCDGTVIMVCYITTDEHGCKVGQEYRVAEDCADQGKICEMQYGDAYCVDPESSDGDDEQEAAEAEETDAQEQQ